MKHICIVCDKEIKCLYDNPADEELEGLLNGGITGILYAGYGSKLDGDIYVIAICDECVKEKELVYIGNYMFPDKEE